MSSIGAGAGASASTGIQTNTSTRTTSIFDYISKNTEEKIKNLEQSDGIFAFTLFRNIKNPHFFERIQEFQTGISSYIELTKREKFTNWVVLVYIDISILDVSDVTPSENTTAEELELYREQLKDFLYFLDTEPNCIFCFYTFPQFIIPGTQFHHNFIGSIARFHAMLQFPSKYVFVRDADTCFPDFWKPFWEQFVFQEGEIGYRVATHFVDYLEEWEYNLLNYHIQKKNPFLLGYEKEYDFYNYRTTPITRVTRFFAGLVNSLPHSPELFTNEHWDAALDFLTKKSTLYKIRGYTQALEYQESPTTYKKNTNTKGLTYYGCDEKILRYIFFNVWTSSQIIPFYFPFSTIIENLVKSTEDNPKSWLVIYNKLLEPVISEAEKSSDLYKIITIWSEWYFDLPDEDRKILLEKIPQKTPGLYTFLIMPSYPYIADELAKEFEGGVPDNIKGGSAKTRKRKGKNSSKSRKNR